MKYRRLISQTTLTVTIAVHTFSLGILWFMSRQEPTYVNAQPISVSQTIPKAAIYGTPVQMIVPSLNLRLNIESGEYDAQTDSWSLSGFNAHFGTMTSPANDTAGNTFVYGHNNPYVFGPLKRIQPGATVEIVADNGNRFFYIYQKSYTVAPNDVSIFKYNGSPILTVQTCTGTWHEKRQLYEFRLDNVIESNEQVAVKESVKKAAIINALAAQLPKQHTLPFPTD